LLRREHQDVEVEEPLIPSISSNRLVPSWVMAPCDTRSFSTRASSHEEAHHRAVANSSRSPSSASYRAYLPLSLLVVGSIATVLVMKAYSERTASEFGARVVNFFGMDSGLCLATQVSMNFGTGIAKFDLDDGTEPIKRRCPFGSSNPEGWIHFECLSSGSWNLTEQSCYSCPSLHERFTYKDGLDRIVKLTPANHGEIRKEPCKFEDGTEFKLGSIDFQCWDGRWSHTDSTCSNSACPGGQLSMPFYGDVGEVDVEVPEGDGEHHTHCPAGSPNIAGNVRFHCEEVGEVPGDLKGKTTGKWIFDSASCEACHPTTMPLKVEEFLEEAELPAGLLGDIRTTECIFDNGHKIYPRGTINYKCDYNGWELVNVSCKTWVCPAQEVTLSMEYVSDEGESTQTEATISLPAAIDGPREENCPGTSRSPGGKILFDCLPDGTWRVHSLDCGYGEQLQESPDSG